MCLHVGHDWRSNWCASPPNIAKGRYNTIPRESPELWKFYDLSVTFVCVGSKALYQIVNVNM
jgi:hypothetical protein